jgi:hypothetical protein
MRRLPRTIQLDASDASVFDQAAEPGEWAVTGSFAFLDDPPEAIAGKRGQAFHHGFLGTSSFGWSTLVMVSSASEGTVEAVIDALARHFVARHGAPSLDAARPVAAREVAFAESLCEHPVGTLLTIYRQHGPDGVVEQFATVHREETPQHGFDLLALAGNSEDTA